MPYQRSVLILKGVMYRLQWSWDLKMCPISEKCPDFRYKGWDLKMCSIESSRRPHFRGCYAVVKLAPEATDVLISPYNELHMLFYLPKAVNRN